MWYNRSMLNNQNSKVRVISVQTCPKIGQRDKNLNKVKELIEINSNLKPDLVVVPEFFNTGVCVPEFKKLAESEHNSLTLQFFSEIAKKYDTYIVVGSIIEKDEDKLYNTSWLLDRKGEITAKYRKIHLFDSFGGDENQYIEYGDQYVVADTDFGKVGLATCFDVKFPKHFVELVSRGAEIVVLPAAWGKTNDMLDTGRENWILTNRVRALDNLVYFISSDLCGKIDSTFSLCGHSMIVDPAGRVLADAGDKEGCICTELDMNFLRNLRTQFDVKKLAE